MKSVAVEVGGIQIPYIDGEYSMIPFDLDSFHGLPQMFIDCAQSMLSGVRHCGGIAFFTAHGKTLKANETLRRGGPHTDGSYDNSVFSWATGGWKVGENGPPVDSEDHNRLYNSETGGIILASNFESCLGWIGEYDGLPGVGGDCSKIRLDEPFMLKKDTIYYGNNHFIHESLPVSRDVHRNFVRITMPHDHVYGN